MYTFDGVSRTNPVETNRDGGWFFFFSFFNKFSTRSGTALGKKSEIKNVRRKLRAVEKFGGSLQAL